MKKINGKQLIKCLESANNNLKYNFEFLNNINIFPVKDGDTGTNIFNTFNNAFDKLNKFFNNVVNDDLNNTSYILETFSNNLALNSLGNSGFIISEWFILFYQYLKKFNSISVKNFILAFEYASKILYSKIIKPQKGTILTLLLEISKLLIQNINVFDCFKKLFNFLFKNIYTILDNTKKEMELLKKYNIIDAGAGGFFFILEGFDYYIKHNKVLIKKLKNPFNLLKTTNEDFQNEVDLGYCVNLKTQLNDIELFNEKIIINDLLKNKKNNSIQTILSEKIFNLHVHTFKPGNIINLLQKYGEFVMLKVENMNKMFIESKSNTLTEKKNNLKIKHNSRLYNFFKKFKKKCDLLVLIKKSSSIEMIKNNLGCENIFNINNVNISKIKNFFEKKIHNKSLIIINDWKYYLKLIDILNKLGVNKNSYKINILTIGEIIIYINNFNKNISLSKNIKIIEKKLKNIKIIQINKLLNENNEYFYIANINNKYLQNFKKMEVYLFNKIKKNINNLTKIITIIVREKKYKSIIDKILKNLEEEFILVEFNLLENYNIEFKSNPINIIFE